MERQDPSLDPLNMLIEELIYNTYLTRQPDLVEEIGKLIRSGCLPREIEKRVNRLIPAGSQVANHVYLIASFLFRKQLPIN